MMKRISALLLAAALCVALVFTAFATATDTSPTEAVFDGEKKIINTGGPTRVIVGDTKDNGVVDRIIMISDDGTILDSADAEYINNLLTNYVGKVWVDNKAGTDLILLKKEDSSDKTSSAPGTPTDTPASQAPSASPSVSPDPSASPSVSPDPGDSPSVSPDPGESESPEPTPTNPGRPGGGGASRPSQSSAPSQSPAPSDPAEGGYPVNGGAGSSDNGSWSMDKSAAKKGDTVTVTSKPNKGYITATPTVTDKDGNTVEVTKTDSGVWTFTMPDGAVTVSVSYITPSQLFSDVAEGTWYNDPLAYAVEHGLVQGYAGEFNHGVVFDRAMMATILYNLDGNPEAPKPTFTDVAADKWYTDAIGWAAANRIVSGGGDNTYNPGGSLTREQMSQIVYNFAGAYKGLDVSGQADLSSFTDVSSIHSWALPGMRWAVNEGIMTGYGTTTVLAPGESATRAQVIMFVANYCQQILGIE